MSLFGEEWYIHKFPQEMPSSCPTRRWLLEPLYHISGFVPFAVSKQFKRMSAAPPWGGAGFQAPSTSLCWSTSPPSKEAVSSMLRTSIHHGSSHIPHQQKHKNIRMCRYKDRRSWGHQVKVAVVEPGCSRYLSTYLPNATGHTSHCHLNKIIGK